MTQINGAAYAARQDWRKHHGDFVLLMFLKALGGRYDKSIKEARSDMREAAWAYGHWRGWF